jgi:hypothetical protein
MPSLAKAGAAFRAVVRAYQHEPCFVALYKEARLPLPGEVLPATASVERRRLGEASASNAVGA